MSDQIITGKIYLSRAPLPGEIEELTAFLNRCAAENRIWINTGCRIKNPDARYKCSVDSGGDEKYLEDRYLPFEITDSKETDACDRLLGGIWYSDNGARIEPTPAARDFRISKIFWCGSWIMSLSGACRSHSIRRTGMCRPNIRTSTSPRESFAKRSCRSPVIAPCPTGN